MNQLTEEQRERLLEQLVETPAGDHSDKITYVQAANKIIITLKSLTLNQVQEKQ